MEVPQNGWFIMEILLEMIWGDPHFRDPPFHYLSKNGAPLGIRTVSLRAVPPRPPRPPTAGVGPGNAGF